jgi:glycosyltransferase involved in cell wall biosynthesis
LPEHKIRILENGVDFQRLRANNRQFTPPTRRPHFAFLGSLAWQKGAHVLIEAFNRIEGAACLTLFGSEATFPEYAAELRANASHPEIRFAGAVDPRDVGAALRTVDCLVVPSLWYENSPLVIQEAFALGVPVVASRLGALEEKVQDGITGRLFAPGNSADLQRVIESIIAQPEQLSQFRANIKPAISIEEHAQLLETIYRDLLSSERR